MLTILSIGDIHIKSGDILYSKNTCNQLIKLTEELKPNITVVMGDILDKIKDKNVEASLNVAIDFFDRLAEITKLYVIIGNHDYPNNSVFLSKDHMFRSLKRWKGVTLCDELIIDYINVPETNISLKCVFLPYVAPGKFKEALLSKGDLDIKSIDLIFCHQEFFGAPLGSIKSTEGDKWDNDDPMVISGHIHCHNLLQPNILYVGTPVQHNFGDADNRTVSLFTLSEKKRDNETFYPFFKKCCLTEKLYAITSQKKIVKNITCDEIEDFENKFGDKYCIIIHGTFSELKTASKSLIVKKWKQELGYKVRYEIHDEAVKHDDDGLVIIDVPYFNNKPPEYKTLLYDKIKDKPELISIYNEVIADDELVILDD